MVSVTYTGNVIPTGVVGTGAVGTITRGGWTNVDDSQTPNWTNVTDTQTPSWVDVDKAA